MTSSATNLLRVRHDDPSYQELAIAEAEFWAKPHILGLESLEIVPVDDPFNRWMNERFTGDPRIPWEATISRHGPFRRGLILGTSALNVEARILETNLELHATFLDISAGALARRQDVLGARFPGRVAIEAMDANFLDLPPNTFDVIASSASIHHVTNLEHLAYQLNRSLTDDGWFFLQDYVGEPQFQFDSGKRLVVEALIRDATPVELRCAMQWKDTSDLSPFCGLRSNEILPVLRQFLSEQSVRTAGALSVPLMRYARCDPTPLPEPNAGVRAWRALDDKLRRFRGQLPRARTYIPAGLLDDLLRVGDILADAGVVAPGNAFAVYRKRK